MTKRKASSASPRSDCPIAAALDLFGDRWTLIVVRDLASGKSRFGELASSAEQIPTNILTERLRELERTGVISRTLYQKHPPRHEYRLTERGQELLPVLEALAAWTKSGS